MFTTMDIVNISFYSALLLMFIAIYAIKYFENGRVRNFMNTYVVRRWGFTDYLACLTGFTFMYFIRNTDVCIGLIIICGIIIIVYIMGMDHFLNRDLEATKNVVDITKVT
jgi:hypothetical protein